MISISQQIVSRFGANMNVIETNLENVNLYEDQDVIFISAANLNVCPVEIGESQLEHLIEVLAIAIENQKKDRKFNITLWHKIKIKVTNKTLFFKAADTDIYPEDSNIIGIALTLNQSEKFRNKLMELFNKIS